MKFTEHLGETLLILKGGLLFLIGPLNAQLAYVAVVIFIDLLFGMRVAAKEKVFSWRVLGSKVSNKLLIYGAWIAMFNALDMAIGLPNTARNAVILILISMEIFSASKNTAKLGYGKLASLMENVYFLITKDNPVAPKEEEKQEGSDKK
jgi:phage-related holin